ncbi:MAG TPA: hypothetical protein VFA06_04545 [Actinocrinis sp.]|uniref:hypothetical protein n=1 Tax=Actinocrinis sp. TaxID=1920516 RepID=UPI002D70CE6C|nr:hypothetical protein [Actinocrinis sp.]HZU55113.1 hypothetical protein [Actinocrinis sp.]
MIAGFDKGLLVPAAQGDRISDPSEVAIMKQVPSTRIAPQVYASKRVRVIRRRRARRELPELDLRTPSGRRTLPY